MVKASVKAMDAVTDFVNKTLGNEISTYCVGGASNMDVVVQHDPARPLRRDTERTSYSGRPGIMGPGDRYQRYHSQNVVNKLRIVKKLTPDVNLFILENSHFRVKHQVQN